MGRERNTREAVVELATSALLGTVGVFLLCGIASGGDYTVTRGTTIASERPIWLLVVEAGLGVIHGGSVRSDSSLHAAIRTADDVRTTFTIDGQPAPGIRGVARAVWRLVGFVVWNADGRIERITDLEYRGRSVRIVDAVEDGRVWVRVTVGPPLGDPRVRCAVLELEATDAGIHIEGIAQNGTTHTLGWPVAAGLADSGRRHSGATIRLTCSAVIDLPGDRCGLIRRIAERVAKREAGTELTSRVHGLAEAGRLAVLDGRGRLTDSVVAEFLERVCR